MQFYSSFAPYYDQIFPYDEEQIQFFEMVFKTAGRNTGESSFLDVGCATGTLISALLNRFERLVGVDLDPELLKIASVKLSSPKAQKVALFEEDMLALDSLFAEEQFDYITCIGNTLPHLKNIRQIGDFLKKTKKILKEDGVFIFQTINYDRVLDRNIRNLPVIDRGTVRFERLYSEPQEDGLLRFETTLRDSITDTELNGSVALFPIRKAKTEELLNEAGLTQYAFYGDYNGSEWQNDSFLTIGVCKW